uniref:Uncharacterized protein n=1 Tax=Cucumis melo TaxID=3656 RepID=A0A9I9D4D6_CUCME
MGRLQNCIKSVNNLNFSTPNIATNHKLRRVQVNPFRIKPHNPNQSPTVFIDANNNIFNSQSALQTPQTIPIFKNPYLNNFPIRRSHHQPPARDSEAS